MNLLAPRVVDVRLATMLLAAEASGEMSVGLAGRDGLRVLYSRADLIGHGCDTLSRRE